MTDLQSTAAPDGRPSSVPELVKAWKVSGRKARVLEARLQRTIEVARRYRRDLLRLAEQNRSWKLQADTLQQKLLELLQQKSPPAETPPLLAEVPESDESVPAEHFRQLMLRLRQAHELIAEFEKLLEFREKQVHELLSRSSQGPSPEDWRLQTLQRELTDARHRIRLLTQELAQQQSRDSEFATMAGRVTELEQQLARLASEGDAALHSQLQQREQQIEHLQEQVHVRLEELRKAVASIHAARDRIKALEDELERVKQSSSEEGGEILNLQDEVARLQDENEHLLGQRASLQEENARLKAAGSTGDKEREAKLEAMVADLRQKLQLAHTKFVEVRSVLQDKHNQLVQLQNRSLELEKSSELVEHGGRTLQAALAESERQNALLKAQVEELRKRPAAALGDASEAMAALEVKLKEARRSAVRAQSEAGQKRKELKLAQDEVQQLKAMVLSLGGTV